MHIEREQVHIFSPSISNDFETDSERASSISRAVYRHMAKTNVPKFPVAFGGKLLVSARVIHLALTCALFYYFLYTLLNRQ